MASPLFEGQDVEAGLIPNDRGQTAQLLFAQLRRFRFWGRARNCVSVNLFDLGALREHVRQPFAVRGNLRRAHDLPLPFQKKALDNDRPRTRRLEEVLQDAVEPDVSAVDELEIGLCTCLLYTSPSPRD